MVPQKKDILSPVILFSIFMVLCICIIIAGYFFYSYEHNRILSQRKIELSAISILKSDQIVQWRKEKLSFPRSVREGKPFIGQIKSYLENTADKDLENKVAQRLESYREIGGYQNIILCDLSGRQVLSVGKATGDFTSDIGGEIKKCSKNLEINFLDIHRNANSGDIHIQILVPITLDVDNKVDPIAVLIFGIDPADFLYPLIQIWPTPSPSSETLLVRREGNEVVYLNELRHKKNTALKLRYSLERTEFPAVRAVLGHQGVLGGVDYRGEKVISAVRKIPGSGWYITAKTDLKELEEPLKARLLLIVIIVIIMISLFGLGLSYLWVTQKNNWLKQMYEYEVKQKALTKNLEYITKYANDVIFLADENFKLVFANEKASEIYGYTHEELMNMGIKELRAPEVKERVSIDMQEAEKHGGIVMETLHKKKDGTIFPIESSTRTIVIDDKKYHQGIIRDISERKKQEKEKVDLQNQLIQSEKMSAIGQLAAGVAHEINNPMTSILGFTQLLLRVHKDGDTEYEKLKKIETSSQRCKDIVQQLLIYSRTKGSEIQPVDIHKMIDAVLVLTKNHLKIMNVTVVKEYADNLLHVAAPQQLEQVFMNIISNARDAMPSGGRLIIQTQMENGKIVVKFTDTGEGISRENLGKIFTPFYTTKKAGQGTGLGLSIVKTLLASMQGDIKVESEVGRGSTFILILPAE
ncbi:MAG: hypothetical protein A2452_09175 [Candidatus Firestonebacteria bacterium RIFOXYC2_FULL_39_67]|nr:MAG: hypothetical protein A2536_01700 [Candidatus Firestonebacteria bacterium RIFOXYD2_FULL_39_29]OGF56881.1 MAG: hypothetical protein A2452_09175 [Candidatus Firestonebacteria bacterium RIFOXYC2_FULL_39_67]